MVGDQRLITQCRAPTGAGAIVRALALVGLLAIIVSACAGGPAPAPADSTPAPASTTDATEDLAVATPVNASQGQADEVVVYASDLPAGALYELELWDDAASPGGKMIGILNNGDELDPPPEDDPHVTFQVQVQPGVPYRCWIHMKVGAPKDKSQANVIWAQISGAVDKGNKEILKPGTGSYLTAEGPKKTGWTWVECDRTDTEEDPLVYFKNSGAATVRLQAGMEGVGFDQFILSPAQFLEKAPSEGVIKK